MKIVVNGWFFEERNITGIGRYAHEILRALDKIVLPGQVVVLVPQICQDLPEYKNIVIEHYGKNRGFIWQQTSLLEFLWKHKEARCLSLTSYLPLLCNRGYVVVYDISPIVNKGFYTKKFRAKTNWQIRLQMRKRHTKIVTISEFSASEINRVFHVSQKRVALVSCGWDHIGRIAANEEIFKQYEMLRKGEYFFSMASITPNKNFNWIIEVAQRNPDEIFAVAGKIDTEIFGLSEMRWPSNVIRVGYVSDSQAKALMQKAKAFIFPSFYEGFGIPPMEALCCGTKAIVSDIPCHREIYGNTVYYIDPVNPNVKLKHVLSNPVEDAEPLLKKYTWENAASQMAQTLQLDVR